VLESSLVLCAFFEKRISDGHLLFSAFWSNVDFNVEIFEGQWVVPDSWRERAREDKSLKMLDFLTFRVNRLCKLLSLSDCWSQSIGRRIGFWLDTHVHLMKQCKERKSGPVRDGHAADMFLYDWRCVPDATSLSIISCLGGDFKTPSSGVPASALFFSRVLNNISMNKQLGNILRDFSKDMSIKHTVCSAVSRCLLGGMSDGTVTTSLDVRLRIHSLSDQGIDDYYDQICNEADKQKRPVILICLREYIIKHIKNDLILDTFLSSNEKWGTYANNVIAAAESLRTLFKAEQHSGQGSAESVLGWICHEAPQSYFLSFSRNARRVPGLLSRDNRVRTSTVDTCKMIRKERDKKRLDNSIVTEKFYSPSTTGSLGLELCCSLKAGEGIQTGDLRKLAGSDETYAVFKQLVGKMGEGKHNLQKFICFPPEFFDVASDCLSVFHISCQMKKFRLPQEYTKLQTKALRARFGDDEEKIKRGSSLLCCLGCSTVKNFIVGTKGKTKGNPYTSHGFKRVCHEGTRLMCDEKRLYECCKTVPLKTYDLVTKEDSAILEYHGVAYVTSTCCGHIVLLKETSPSCGSPFTCLQCMRQAAVGKKNISQLESCCCWCERKLTKSNKGFVGMFIDGSGDEKEKSFCKAHTRKFMKKEYEPMNLEEVMRTISSKKFM
jgi:hypothetical protein